MRLELKRLQRGLGITAVHVTHDQGEALAMSNTVAVMKDGAIQQIGPPREIYERPASRFVADFIGSSNFFTGIVESIEPAGVHVVATPQGKIRASSEVGYDLGSSVVVSIRPEHIQLELGLPDGGSPNRWEGLVVMRGFLGESVDHLVRVGQLDIRVRSNTRGSVSRGEEVTVVLPEDSCSLIPDG
jgi:iron(III) transport system ATP-binding protein